MNNFYRFNYRCNPFPYFGPYRRNLYYNSSSRPTNSFSQNVAQSNGSNNSNIPSSSCSTHFFNNCSNVHHNDFSNNCSNAHHNDSSNNCSNAHHNDSSNLFGNNISSCKTSRNLPPNSNFELDLFGLKLYFDDVLILSLLFFLYKEDVKDEWLFLALVLLLIS